MLVTKSIGIAQYNTQQFWFVRLVSSRAKPLSP